MKKIIRLTESDLVRLIKRVIKEETKSDCSSTGNPEVFESDMCTEGFSEMSRNIAFGVANACSCLVGGVSYYIQNWDENKLLDQLSKINSESLYNEVNEILACIMDAQGWKNIYNDNEPYPLVKIVSLISTSPDLKSKMSKILKRFKPN